MILGIVKFLYVLIGILIASIVLVVIYRMTLNIGNKKISNIFRNDIIKQKKELEISLLILLVVLTITIVSTLLVMKYAVNINSYVSKLAWFQLLK